MTKMPPPDSKEAEKRLDALLCLSDEKFKTLCDIAPFGIYQTDAAGRCLHTNRKWQQIYGLSSLDSLGDNWASTIHAEDQAAVFAAWQIAVASPHDFHMAFRIWRGDGQIRHVKSTARAMKDAAGAVCGYVGVVEDVTELVHQDHRLRASESLLDRTGRIAGVGGWQLDLPTKALVWSTETYRIHDLEPGHALSFEGALAFFSRDARASLDKAIAAATDQGAPWDLELPLTTAKGRAIWVRSFGEAEHEGEKIVRLVGAFQDITEQRQRKLAFRQEQALRQQIEKQAIETERLLHERTEMLDVLAHEVRQPLHNASAALQSAEGVLRGHEHQAAAGRLVKAQAMFSQVLSSIDNTLAAAALLGSGTISQVSDTDLDAFVALTIADVPMPVRKRIQIDRRSTIRTVPMNMGLMRLALRNLLFNALVSSADDAHVTVRLTDSETPPALFIDVEDQGPGFVDPELLSRLFQRGNRGQHASKPGHGLGLYIVRRVMELHGGYAQLQHNQAGLTCMRLALLQSAED